MFSLESLPLTLWGGQENDMAQHVTSLAPKPNGPSSVLKTDTEKKKTNSCMFHSDL